MTTVDGHVLEILLDDLPVSQITTEAIQEVQQQHAEISTDIVFEHVLDETPEKIIQEAVNEIISEQISESIKGEIFSELPTLV